MSELLQDPISLILALAVILATLLYLIEHNKRKKIEGAGDRILEELQEKSWNSLHQSIQKSQDILGMAELEGIKVVAGTKLETSKFEGEIEKQLQAILAQSQQTIASAQNQLLAFLQDLQKRSEAFEQIQKNTGEQRINQMFDRVETRLSDFLVQTEQKTASSIELELKAARQLIDTYKNEQLKLIDENIIAMMEQTLSLVVSKKLNLKDQMDLVYEALEKAKIEKFVV